MPRHVCIEQPCSVCGYVVWHSYGYEIWPDPMPAASYPMLVPEHVILFVRDDAPATLLPTTAPGQSAHRVQHNRYNCVPPCEVRSGLDTVRGSVSDLPYSAQF